MSEEMHKLIFSRNLNFYLSKNGKNQQDLINDLGLSSSTVSNWCTGLKFPRMDKIQMLADYLKINKSDLIEDKSNEEKEEYYLNAETKQVAQEIFENKDLRALFDAAKDASPEDLKTVHTMLMALKNKERNE